MKKSQPLKVEKVQNATPERLEEWAEKALREANPTSVKPQFLFNMDETMLDSTSRKVSVVVPKDVIPIRLNSNESEGLHITLVFCIAADGTSIKPCIILPVKEFPLGLEDSLDYFHFMGHGSGWMTASLFELWVTKHFIPSVQKKRVELNLPNERALLFVDAHESRRCAPALQALTDANIDVFTFPSHTSHILQPLDCGVNRSFKMKLRSSKSLVLHRTVGDRRKALIELASKCAYEALYKGTVQKAWAESGLYPWSLTQMSSSPYVVRGELNLPPKKRKRSGIKLNETLLIQEEFIAMLRAESQKVQAPKRPRGRPRKKPRVIDSESSESDDKEDAMDIDSE